jgi:hypothetical protein
MNRFGVLVALAALVGCMSVGAGSAHAQIFAPSYGFAGGTGPYNLYTQDLPPFYALYPPVYYSQPIARTYGFSPFAYPPGYPTPQNYFSPPPGMRSSAGYSGGAPTPMPTAMAQTTPLVIENPFVQAAKP